MRPQGISISTFGDNMLCKMQILNAMERKALEREVDNETSRRYRKLCAAPVPEEIKP